MKTPRAVSASHPWPSGKRGTLGKGKGRRHMFVDEHEAAVLEKEEQNARQNLKRGGEKKKKKERVTKKSIETMAPTGNVKRKKAKTRARTDKTKNERSAYRAHTEKWGEVQRKKRDFPTQSTVP